MQTPDRKAPASCWNRTLAGWQQSNHRSLLQNVLYIFVLDRLSNNKWQKHIGGVCMLFCLYNPSGLKSHVIL